MGTRYMETRKGEQMSTHKVISFVKSFIRIAACIISLVEHDPMIIVGGFLVAEVVGIIEENFESA